MGQAPLPALGHFKVRPSYATDMATAAALVAEIITDAGDGRIAVDFETTPLPKRAGAPRGYRAPRGRGEGEGSSLRRATMARGGAALTIAKAELAALRSAEDHAGRAGLDPQRSTVRLCTLYGGGPASP